MNVCNKLERLCLTSLSGLV